MPGILSSQMQLEHFSNNALLYNSSVASEEKSFQISANAGKKSLPLHVNSSATRIDKSNNFWIPELHNKQYL